jgi:penicillin amidase
LLIPALGEDLFSAYLEIFNQCIVPVDEILRNPESPWFCSRSRGDLVALSLREATAELAGELGTEMKRWHWGRIHSLSFTHPFGRLRYLRPALSIGPFAAPGDGMTINMGFYRHSVPFRHTVGPSLRFVIDLGNLNHSCFIIPTGQSGHWQSPHDHDQTDLWRDGRYLRISVSEIERNTIGRLALTPAPMPRPLPQRQV